MIAKYCLISGIAFLLFSCKGSHNRSVNTNTTNNTVPVLNIKYIHSYPHDTTSFTEGLLFHNGELFESTGSPEYLPQTRSLFGPVDLRTGRINKKAEINRSNYFGEGIAFLDGKVFQLTYKSRTGFAYDATTFKKLKEFVIPRKEGWGLTTDGMNLIMSDGTYELTYLNPETFQIIKKITVTENGIARGNLNELEYIKGFIYANIWTTNTIVKIDPGNGKVVGKLDLSLYASEARYNYKGSLEMNGIAYDSVENRIFITGKLWPEIYEFQILDGHN